MYFVQCAEVEALRRNDAFCRRVVVAILEQAFSLRASLGAMISFLAQRVVAGEEGEGGGLAGVVERLLLPCRAAEQRSLCPYEVVGHVDDELMQLWRRANGENDHVPLVAEWSDRHIGSGDVAKAATT